MKAVLAALAILTLVAAFAAGRYSRGVEMDPSAVESFRQSMDEGNALIRSQRFNGFLETLGPDNLDEAVAIVEAKQAWLDKSEVRNFILAWARFDPSGALDWARSQRLRDRMKAAAAAMYAWAFYDQRGAHQALSRLEKFERLKSHRILKEKYALGWMRGGDRDRVALYLSRQPADIFRQKATTALVKELMSEGPEVLIQWVEAVPDTARDGYKAVAFQKAANILAQIDPVYASRWIEGHLGHSYSNKGLSAIALRWVDWGDPTAAFDWLLGLPAGNVRDDVVAGTIKRWEERDPEIARNWLHLATPAEALDSAVAFISRADTRRDPRSALEWAERVHDPTERRDLIVGTARQWLRRDPESASEWLEDSELAEDIQAEIQQTPPVPVRRLRGRQAPIEEGRFDAIQGADGIGEA